MATATFPALTGTPTEVQITFYLVDASGDLWSENFIVASTAAIGDIEGLAQTYQLASQASIYRVDRNQVWKGTADPQNADGNYRGQVESGINMLFRNASNFTRSFRLVAPIGDVMQGAQDIPLITAAEFTNMLTDYLTLASGFNLETVQYTSRRERKNNPKIRV